MKTDRTDRPRVRVRIAPMVALCAAMFLWTPSARAEDLSSALYSDIRDIIQDLIRHHVGKTVSEFLARTTYGPALKFYFRGALERMESGYWGSVARELRIGITELVTDGVYWHLTQPPGQRTTFDLRAFLAAVPLTDKSLVDANCTGTPAAEKRFACDVAKAVRAEISSSPREVTYYAEDALSLIFEQKTKGPLNDPATTFRAWLATPGDFQRQYLGAIQSEAVTRAIGSQTCSTTVKEETDYILSGADAPLSCIAWTFRKHRDASLTVTFGVGQRLTAPSTIPASTLLRIQDERSASELVSTLLKGAPVEACAAQQVAVGEGTCSPDKQTKLDISVQGTALESAQRISDSWVAPKLTRAVMRAAILARESSELERVMSQFGFNAGKHPVDALKTLPIANKLVAFALRAKQIETARGDEGASASSALGGIMLDAIALVGEEPAKCRSQTLAAACETARLFEMSKFLGIVRRASHGDYRGMAAEILAEAVGEQLTADADTEVFDLCRYEPRADTGKTGSLCKDFLIAFASYALDMAENNDDKVNRAAFKAAAEKLLSEENSGRRGFRDRNQVSSPYWQALLVPSVALRASWSPDYFNNFGSDGYRTVVSIDWLTLVRYTSPFSNHFGIQVSLIDFARPLSELALRRRVSDTFNDDALVFTLVTPRADLLFGIPELTRSLLVSVGGSLSPVVARQNAATNTLTYLPIWARDGSAPGGEFNLGVKLLF